MRLSPVLAALLVALGTGVAANLPARAASSSSVAVRFLFDFGDGTYTWSNATVAQPSAANASWNATLAAAAHVHVALQWSWSSTFGVYITDVGNRSPPGGVGLYVWNATASRWDALVVGISTLVFRDGDVLAVSDNGFDPVTYATLYPVPTPLNPYPVQEFREDLANSGDSGSSAPGMLSVHWDANLSLEEIPASPAVAYGRVYILTLDGLFALNEGNGSVVWDNRAIRGLSTPAVFNGTLILGGSDGRLHAINAADGAELWNVTLIPHPQFSGVTSSPKLWFDTVYVGTFNETGGVGEVVALWATNGTIRWRHPAPASINFSSAAVSDGTVFIGVIGKYNTTTQTSYGPPFGVLALDATTGAFQWFYPTGGPVAASPVVTRAEVIVPAKDGFVYALDETTGTLVWKTDAAGGVSSAALVGSTVVVGGGSLASGGRVTALDVTNGTGLWTFSPNGLVQSSIAAADGKVFLSTNVANGTVYALNASTGRMLSSYTPSPAQYILGSPVVADGFVFAPSDNGHVYCFQEVVTAAPSSIPWVSIGLASIVLLVAIALAAVWVARRRPRAR